MIKVLAKRLVALRTTQGLARQRGKCNFQILPEDSYVRYCSNPNG
jgi:hypothetical protein